MTIALPPLRGRWCPSCGAGAAWDDEVCPACGFPLEPAWGGGTSRSADEPVALEEEAAASVDPDADEADDTKSIPRIESAVPAEHDPESKVAVQESMPRTSRLAFAAAASAALVCGLALAITHPWDPDVYAPQTTKGADTSMAGFPGTMETLTGQDSDGRPVEIMEGDDATFAQLTEEYEKLGTYAGRADESEALFEEVAYGPDLDERLRGRREVEALAIDTSNLIERLERVDVTSGTYAEDRDRLVRLGNWLRNRIDTLRKAWTAAAESEDPAADADRLRAVLTADAGEDGTSGYKALFDESYEAWRPVRADGA